MTTPRFASLDMVRGAAAWVVAIPHFFLFHSRGGETLEAAAALGVEIFFVLSGYVLAPQIIFVVSDSARKHLWTFLVRRWMRTVPPFLLALVVISLMTDKVGSWQFYTYAVYSQNLFWKPADDYFSVAWSLSVEEWFYVVFPIFLLLGVGLFGRARLTALAALTVGFIAAIMLLRITLGDFDDWGASVRRVVVFRLDAIASGFLLYLVVQWKAAALMRWTIATHVLILIGTMVCGMWTVLAIGWNGSLWAKHVFPIVAAAFGAACILTANRVEPHFSERDVPSRLAFFLGRTSYSIYLFHMIIIIALASFTAGLPLLAQFAVYLAVVMAFCPVFNYYFERPILEARPSYKDRTPGLLAETQIP